LRGTIVTCPRVGQGEDGNGALGTHAKSRPEEAQRLRVAEKPFDEPLTAMSWEWSAGDGDSVFPDLQLTPTWRRSDADYE